MLIAEVLINRTSKKLDKTFSYFIPPELDFITTGYRVIVPFAEKKEEGIVLSIHDTTPDRPLLMIYESIGVIPYFTSGMLWLAKRISEYYLCTRLDALRLFMTERNNPVREDIYITSLGKQNLDTLAPLHLIGNIDFWNRQGISVFEEISLGNLAITPRGKYQSTWLKIRMNIDKKELKTKKKQYALYMHLAANGSEESKSLITKGFSKNIQKEALKNRFVCEEKRLYLNTSTSDISLKEKSRRLTSAQSAAVNEIDKYIVQQKNHVFLLDGVTGSGKTEVYIRNAKTALQLGKAVLILVPEIALTDQMVQRMTAYFGEQVVYSHSKLSISERVDNWYRIRNGIGRVVVGARSALFLPLENIGLIVIDEEYDASYKQEETPRYHAGRLAEWLGEYHQCPVVRGAATPSIQSFYRARKGEISSLSLPFRIGNTTLPKIHLVDMRSELASGNRSIFSNKLTTLLDSTLRKRKQSILLLNRRGYSTHVFCRNCGYVSQCSNCDMPLTFHIQSGQLKCHRCDKTYSMPEVCPTCHSKAIKHFGIGTQKVVEVLESLFPFARIARLDRDSIQKKDALKVILNKFRNNEIDILVGTQILAKGHDLPNVQTVGILSIDSALQIPHFSSSERVYNLIIQAAGRAGRRREQGEVVLQTYHPQHYAIKSAASYDYQSYYKEELKLRRAFGYPPFVEMIKISVFHSDYQAALEQIKSLYQATQKSIQDNSIYFSDVYDEFFGKLRNKYFLSFEIKGQDLSKVKDKIRSLSDYKKNGIIIDIDIY